MVRKRREEGAVEVHYQGRRGGGVVRVCIVCRYASEAVEVKQKGRGRGAKESRGSSSRVEVGG